MKENKMFFYRLTKKENHWSIAFLSNDAEEKIETIQDDIDKLREFFNENKDAIFIGANNYIADDKIITSLLKHNNLNEKVSAEEVSATLPITLDITEGIVKNTHVDFYNIICSMWQDNAKIMPYSFALNEKEEIEQLTTDVCIIKSIYEQEERQNFLNWKINIINKYQLPKEAYYYSWGQLMKTIIGLDLDKTHGNSFSTDIKIVLDPNLAKALEEKDSQFLNNLYKDLNDKYPLFKLYKMIETALKEEDSILIHKILQETKDKNFLFRIYEMIDRKAKKEENNAFLQNLQQELSKQNLYKTYQEQTDNQEITTALVPPITIDGCKINFSEQGILGTTKTETKATDCIDTNPYSKYAYLYIDFNSFGPNILINNHWLDKIAEYPERYEQIKNQRMELKNLKKPEQLYYKYMLNSGLDYLIDVNTKNEENIGLSLAINGIMVMMLLYQNIKEHNATLIECNTDGIIVRCPKENVESIKEEVKKIENQLNLSCDVDVINKIVHFDNQNYVIQFENKKIKHIGVFGAFQTHPLYCSGIPAVEIALREYYLNDIPVGRTLENLLKENNIRAFQEIRRKKTNSKQKYIKIDGVYIPYTKRVSRYFAVIPNGNNNCLYTQNKKGKYEEYRIKRGKSIKDGYYHLVLADEKIPNRKEIDITYYLDKCYKIINNHKNYNVEILKKGKDRISLVDIDGTLISNIPKEVQKKVFYDAAADLVDKNKIDEAYQNFYNPKGGKLFQFLGQCKNIKGYGEYFPEYLCQQEIFGTANLNLYKEFVQEFKRKEAEAASRVTLYGDAIKLLEYLKSIGYVYPYSNWLEYVQRAKLEAHNISQYFDGLCTIDDYYAKSSTKGWEDILSSLGIDLDKSEVHMFGNSTSDIVPVKIGIPYAIVNRTGKGTDFLDRLPKTGNGLVVPNFYSIEIIDKELSIMGNAKRKKYNR